VKNFKDAEIIEGIINNNTEVIEYVYNTYFPLLSYKLIKNIKLNEDDAWDIFQDTIVVVFNYLKEKEGVLNYSFNAFIYSVCKRLVSNRFRKMFNSLEEIKGFEIENISLETSKSSNYDFPENIINEREIQEHEKLVLIQKHFLKIQKDCRKILKMFFDNQSMKAIALKMGFKNEDYAKRRKHMCMGFLKESIKKDKLFIYLQEKNDE